MTELYASLGGARASSCALTIPYYGLWSADGMLPADSAIEELTTLVIGNLTLTGAVHRQAAFAGSRSLRLVGGRGGWRKPLSARAYANPIGLRRSVVLGDAARECG